MNEQALFRITALFGGFMGGGICGLLPFGVAIRKRHRPLAIRSWILCVLVGLVLGALLALPVALTLTVFVLYLNRPASEETDCASKTEQKTL